MRTTNTAGRIGVWVVIVLGTTLAAGAARAANESFQVQLTAARRVQTNATGTADVNFDPATRVLSWSISYSALSGPVTMAHVNQAPAGTDGPVVMWLARRGHPVGNPVTGRAQLSVEQAMQFSAGNWYIVLHTQAHPDGELRGQLMPPGH